MKTVVIVRAPFDDQGTPGALACAEVGFKCRILELPWRDNKNQISCIPAGEYIVYPYTSPKFGRVYHIDKVPRRSAVLFHSGTWAGDTTKELRTHSHGCLLVGAKRAIVAGQKAIVLSKDTMRRFKDAIGDEPFKLIIR